jgi:hypothetical protein
MTLRELLDRLQARRDDPASCLDALLLCARDAASPRDLALDLSTAAICGVLDHALSERLLGALTALERQGGAPSPPELRAPGYEALATEVAALERRSLEALGRREAAVRLEQEVADKVRRLAELDQRLETLRNEVAAAEQRCLDQQRRLEGSHDEHPHTVAV